MMITLILLALLLAASGLYFALQVVQPKVYSVSETYRTEINCGRMTAAALEDWQPRDIWLDSPFGYSLYGLYLPVAGS
jgi:hypothetical protein